MFRNEHLRTPKLGRFGLRDYLALRRERRENERLWAEYELQNEYYITMRKKIGEAWQQVRKEWSEQ